MLFGPGSGAAMALMVDVVVMLVSCIRVASTASAMLSGPLAAGWGRRYPRCIRCWPEGRGSGTGRNVEPGSPAKWPEE